MAGNKKSSTPRSIVSLTQALLILIALLLGLIILGTGFYLGTNQKKTSTLSPTVFPAQNSTTVPTSAQPDDVLASPTGVTIISSGPNPASAFCTQQGGTLSINTRGDGGQYGLCTFDGGYACEEWALYRGECPMGGVRTTGYDTIQQKYCAWSGGSTFAEENATCTFADSSTCTDEALYNGTCSKGSN